MQKKIGIALIVLGVTAYLITQFGGFNLSDFGVLSILCLLNGVADILTGVGFYKTATGEDDI